MLRIKAIVRNAQTNISLSASIILISLSSLSACAGIGTQDTKAADYNAELGIRYLQQGRLKLANVKLLKSLEQNPNSVPANHYYALLQQKLKQPKVATRHFERAIRYAPKNPELRNNYGSFLCKNNHPKAAVQQFLTAVKDPLYSTPEFAYTNAGICLRKYNPASPEAEQYFRTALKKKASFPSALLEMGKLYKDRGDYQKAQAFMLRYETVGQSSPDALQLCAIINSKIGDPAKAKMCKSTLLRLFPSSPEAEQIGSTR